MFIVKWITHFNETSPAKTENCFDQDLDELVASCLERLPAMRMQADGLAPDGFLIFADNRKEMRRWFATAPAEKLAVSY